MHPSISEQTNPEEENSEQTNPGRTNPERTDPERPNSEEETAQHPEDWRQAVRGRHEKTIPRVGLQLATGVTIGCFAGTGYGLAIGMGTIISGSRNTAVIVPSPRSQPFAHDGPMVGAFCGVVAGGGFATGVGVHLGYRWRVFDDLYQAVAAILVHSTTHLSSRIRSFFHNQHPRPALRTNNVVHINARHRRPVCLSFADVLHRRSEKRW